MLYKVKFEVTSGLNMYYTEKKIFEENIFIPEDLKTENLEEKLILAIKEFLVENKKVGFICKICPSLVNVNLIFYSKLSGGL